MSSVAKAMTHRHTLGGAPGLSGCMAFCWMEGPFLVRLGQGRDQGRGRFAATPEVDLGLGYHLASVLSVSRGRATGGVRS